VAEIQHVQQSNYNNPTNYNEMPTMHQQAWVFVQQEPDFEPDLSDNNRQKGRGLGKKAHKPAVKLQKVDNGRTFFIQKSNNSQQSNSKTEPITTPLNLLDALQVSNIAPIVVDKSDKKGQAILELQTIQNEIQQLKNKLGDKNNGLIGERNKARDQQKRAEKSFQLANGLPAQTKANEVAQRYKNQYQEFCTIIDSTKSQLNDLQQKEAQLQRKLQSIGTPIEIKEVENE
jgi:prefoldin subunit 5